MTDITSRKNPVIAHIRKLNEKRAYRYECRQFVCDGAKLMEEALAAGARIDTVLVREDITPAVLPEGAKIYRVDGEMLKYASRLETPADMLFGCGMPDPALPETVEGGVILLDCVQDPGNVGTVLRTADAFSIGMVLLINGCADPYNPKTVRSTMGAVFRQPFFETELSSALALLRRSGKKLYGAALSHDAAILGEAPIKNMAVAIGNEGSGLSAEVLGAAKEKIFIPMTGKAESLNAAVAASIIMWEMTR